MDKDGIWKNALAALEIETSKASFAAFLSKTKLTSLTKGEAVISCPSLLIAERLKKRYSEIVKKTLTDLTGTPYRPVFEVNQTTPFPSLKTTELGPLFTKGHNRSNLFSSYTFENFVVGPSNQLAHAAALSVTEQPGTLHNPLLIHAGVGLGKTHLMHAIGNAVKEREPEAKICYCPAETFTNEFIEAIQERRAISRFKKKYRSVDLLLVDDIQFLAGREATQEEFFNTFNGLYLSKKQVILTSDRHPQEIRKLEARLVSRFSGGMVADIQPPDLDLRIAILKQKAKERKVSLDDQVFLTLAEQVAGSIRQLEGTLTQLLLLSQTHQNTPPEKLVETLALSPKQTASPMIPTETILTKTCRFFRVDREALVGRGRERKVVLPRQVVMYLLRELTDLPLEEIGEVLGGRDHSTIFHGIRTIEERINKEPSFRQKISTLKQQQTS